MVSPCQGKTNGKARVTPSPAANWALHGENRMGHRGQGWQKALVACLLPATLVGCCEGFILASISFNLSCSFGPSLR